jgi:hypothetical protein
VQHHESGTTRRNNPRGAQRPRCVFLQRNLAHAHKGTRRGINISGVDFWHAVEFSRNGSCLHGRFTGPSGLSLRCVPDSIRPFPVPDPQSAGAVFPAVGPFRRGETLADVRQPFQIGPIGLRIRSSMHSGKRTRGRTPGRGAVARTSDCCGMAVRGPTEIGAHVGQPGVRYAAGGCVSTSCPGLHNCGGRATLRGMTLRTRYYSQWWAA